MVFLERVQNVAQEIAMRCRVRGSLIGCSGFFVFGAVAYTTSLTAQVGAVSNASTAGSLGTAWLLAVVSRALDSRARSCIKAVRWFGLR